VPKGSEQKFVDGKVVDTQDISHRVIDKILVLKSAHQLQLMSEGVKPGSMIMIHGTPIDEQYPEWYFQTLDWTNGCIAMKNSDIREVWDLVKDGTMIEIRP